MSIKINKQLKDSLILGLAVVTGISTVCTVLGFSMKDAFPFPNMPFYAAVIIRIVILLLAYLFITGIIWYYKGIKYNDSIVLKIRNNNVTIRTGDLFNTKSWRVIPVDTHVDTTTDESIINAKSLQGQLIRKVNNDEEIKKAVESEANKRKIKSVNGKYTFDLGTVIPYKRSSEEKYLLVVLTEIDERHEARTTLVEYEKTLMKMWDEMPRFDDSDPVSLPILGNGVTRFEDGRDSTGNLIRCMLCTLNTSGVHLNSGISLLLYSNDEDKDSISLYEYKDIYRNWIHE